MCIFCQIIAGKIPSYKIYEDDKTIAFLDIKPVNPGHVLVIPKNHVSNLEKINEDDLKALILVVKKIGQLLQDKLNCPAYNVILNNGEIAGQEISHLHFHLIPRFKGDGLKHFPHKEYTLGEVDEIVKKLRS
jgi:histidine triad (HIT) family protein